MPKQYKVCINQEGEWVQVGKRFAEEDLARDWAENHLGGREYKIRGHAGGYSEKKDAWQAFRLYRLSWEAVGPVHDTYELAEGWLSENREDWWEATRIHPAAATDEMRFFRKLLPDGDCWRWAGATMIWWRKKAVSASQVSWEIQHGSPPTGAVLRTCTIHRDCIRHLAIGRKHRARNTKRNVPPRPKVDRLRFYQKDEIRDLAKTTTWKEIAEEYGVTVETVEAVIGTEAFHKLTDAEKTDIRDLWLGKQMSQAEIAEKFRISRSEVRSIVVGSMHGERRRDPLLWSK